MLNKIRLILILLVLSSVLYAGDFSMNLAMGYRDSITTNAPIVLSFTADVDDFLISTQIQPKELSAGFGYDLRVGKTISNIFYLHTLYVPEEGGFSDLSYIFKQRFSWEYFAIGYGIGVQGGVSYSPYATTPLWSLSPLVLLGVDFKFNPVVLSFSLSLNNRLERSWKAVPIYDASIEFLLDEHSSVVISGFLRQAEYLMDQWHMMTAWGVSLGYVYRRNM